MAYHSKNIVVFDSRSEADIACSRLNESGHYAMKTRKAYHVTSLSSLVMTTDHRPAIWVHENDSRTESYRCGGSLLPNAYEQTSDREFDWRNA
jgi:hypothetical protein